MNTTVASASEELASTAEEMSSQAESLQQLMAFFKIPTGHRGSEAPPMAAHAGATVLAPRRQAAARPAHAPSASAKAMTDRGFERF